jgi:hypothetical protein
MTTLATLQTRLSEAEEALHAILTGTKEVSLEFGSGRKIAYNQGSISELRGYIARLTDQIAVLQGTGAGRKPVRFVF